MKNIKPNITYFLIISGFVFLADSLSADVLNSLSPIRENISQYGQSVSSESDSTMNEESPSSTEVLRTQNEELKRKLASERRNIKYYLFPAYMVIWLLLFGYIYNLSRKQKALFREIEGLKKTLREQGKQ